MIKSTKSLRKGDVIVALDGHRLPKAVEVTRHIENDPDGTVIVEVKQRPESVISPKRYLRQKRAEVGKRVTLAGLKLIKLDDEHYVTEDGRYEVYRDAFPTECEAPHPVKMTRKLRDEILRDKRLWCFEAVYAAENYLRHVYNYDTGRSPQVKGYMCPGGEEHHYYQWTAYDTLDQGLEIGHWQDTPTDAADDLRRHLEAVAA